MISEITYINLPCGHIDLDVLENCSKCQWYNDDVVLVNELTLSNINKTKCSSCAENNHEKEATIIHMPCQCMIYCSPCSIDYESKICICGEGIECVAGWNHNIYL